MFLPGLVLQVYTTPLSKGGRSELISLLNPFHPAVKWSFDSSLTKWLTLASETPSLPAKPDNGKPPKHRHEKRPIDPRLVAVA